MEYELITICEPVTDINTILDTIETEYDNDAEYADCMAEYLKTSPLYNHKVKLGKTSRRLINMITSTYGDILESITPNTYRLITGKYPDPSIIQHQNVLRNNKNAGRIPTYYAIDYIYSELGYNSDQELLDDAERIKLSLKRVK